MAVARARAATDAGETSDTRALRNYVAGAWREPEAGGWLEDRDPATGQALTRVPLSTAAEVDRAVRAVRDAQPAWAAVPPQRRARAVMALRDRLVSYRDELARLNVTVGPSALADTPVIVITHTFEL